MTITTKSEVNKLTVAKLKEELGARRLSQDGLKVPIDFFVLSCLPCPHNQTAHARLVVV